MDFGDLVFLQGAMLPTVRWRVLRAFCVSFSFQNAAILARTSYVVGSAGVLMVLSEVLLYYCTVLH